MTPSSSVHQAREAFGRRLREIRKDAGLTARALAELAGWHESKCSRIENGHAFPTERDIRAWSMHCGAGEQIIDLIATARGIEGMYVEWRRMEHTGLKLAQQSVAPLFERTKRFRAYSSWLIPGPLQTAAYTRAVLHGTAQRRNLPNDVEEAVAVRMDRQRVLYEGDHRFAILMEESSLRKSIGGSDVMVGQLGHLLTVGSLPSVSLGLIPDFADRSLIHPVEDFWIFDDAQVGVELVSAYLTVTQPSEIEMYVATFAALAELAVHGSRARSLITAAIDAIR